MNLIVSDKQPQLQYLDMAAAREHCARGAAEWEWAGTVGDGEPDVVMACAGDIVTMEALAAAELLRRFTPDLEVPLRQRGRPHVADAARDPSPRIAARTRSNASSARAPR